MTSYLSTRSIASELGLSQRQASDLAAKEMAAIDVSREGSARPTWRVAQENFDAWRLRRPGVKSAAVAIESAHKRAASGEAVYFIQGEGADALVKIGYSRDVDQRFAELQKYCPVKLTLLVAVRGDLFLEKWFHERFSAHRAHGEWFRPVPELLEMVEFLKVAA